MRRIVPRETLTGRVVYDRKKHYFGFKDVRRIVNARGPGLLSEMDPSDMIWLAQTFVYLEKLYLKKKTEKMSLEKRREAELRDTENIIMSVVGLFLPGIASQAIDLLRGLGGEIDKLLAGVQE